MNTMSLQQQLSAKKQNKAAQANRKVEVYDAGDRVHHDKFGDGTVLSSTPMAGDSMLEIAFDEVGTKKIMANFAQMNKI